MMEIGSSLGMTPGMADIGSKGSFPSLSAFASAIQALLKTDIDEIAVLMNRYELKKQSTKVTL
jgi:hypothetical protein